MEVLCSSSVGTESLLSSAMVALLAEISTSVVKSLACLLLVMGSGTNRITIEFPREPRQIKRLSKADLYMEKQHDPETKDASETEDDDEDKDDEEDDGGEDGEDFSGEEEDDEDDKDSEDEPEANGDGGNGDDDDEDEDDDEDGDGEEEDDEEEEDEDEDEETPQPPAKKRK